MGFSGNGGGLLCSLEQRAQFVPPPFNGESFLELWERGGVQSCGQIYICPKIQNISSALTSFLYQKSRSPFIEFIL